jgi:hypothetical protein
MYKFLVHSILLGYFFLFVVKQTIKICLFFRYIRSLRPLGVSKYFGPYVMMIGRMIENMMYFVVLVPILLKFTNSCNYKYL